MEGEVSDARVLNSHQTQTFLQIPHEKRPLELRGPSHHLHRAPPLGTHIQLRHEARVRIVSVELTSVHSRIHEQRGSAPSEFIRQGTASRPRPGHRVVNFHCEIVVVFLHVGDASGEDELVGATGSQPHDANNWIMHPKMHLGSDEPLLLQHTELVVNRSLVGPREGVEQTTGPFEAADFSIFARHDRPLVEFMRRQNVVTSCFVLLEAVFRTLHAEPARPRRAVLVHVELREQCVPSHGVPPGTNVRGPNHRHLRQLQHNLLQHECIDVAPVD
ncbi:hypothetical protein Mapa_005767 [Marchantia paleacea]|nr:hypothetical protein Mapa_005767 [Marchantia paleacea]